MVEAIRVLPMDSQYEFNGKLMREVQDQFFMRELPARKRDGRRCIYCYKTKALNTPNNGKTLVLFQYDAKIIAKALLLDTVKVADSDEYGGYYAFDIDTLSVFDPLDATTIGKIFNKKIRFGQIMHKLPAKYYEDFMNFLKNEKKADANIKFVDNWRCIPESSGRPQR